MVKKKKAKALGSRELPRPGYDNSFIFSMAATIPEPNSPEMNYFLTQFSNGLYTRFTFTNFLSVSMDWQVDINKADAGIQGFKNRVDALVKKLRPTNAGLHLILTYGVSRNAHLYNAAKKEDIRNAQWFNDNNLNSRTLVDGEINNFVITSFSRYARKLRKHLETVVKASFKYLKSVQQKNPDLLLIISAPGESELNATRMNSNPVLQEYFCDYSPFALLEFRDWLKHEGMYGSGGKYQKDGYPNGGTRYQGTNGLKNFNIDFSTAFTTWNLKYFNWKLSDPVDTDYTDNINKDPNIIPFSQYQFDGMMNPSGSHVIAGGFDAPRKMKYKGGAKGEDRFWDLFQQFRETLVHHFVKDMAAIAGASGFAKDRYYTHQIPAEYLWGTRPNDPDIPLNYRYYASASPLWTADAYADTGAGLTMYDVNFLTHYGRTSKYAVPAIAAMSDNWGVLEYNPEIIFSDNINDINTVDNIYRQFQRLYDHHAHIISCFKWEAGLKYRFKGTNREYAAKKFFDAVKDKARQSIDTVFIPPTVQGFSSIYQEAGEVAALSWSEKIWIDSHYSWIDWGDFKEFRIYRGYTENFPCNGGTQIARTRAFSFADKSFSKTGTVYYKIAALNLKNELGALAVIAMKESNPPFGVFETPVNESRVSGSIAVTGWALDDIEVESVKIYNKTGNQWAFVGDAIFVEGTRPDVAEAYKTYPNNTRAGWGYLLLTNLLPGKGNGTYQLKAVARSIDGGETELGVKTIISDNKHAVKPFGAIDTPAQGGIVSGSTYVNFGWALTPQPNMIPVDGSTINVYIDGVMVGHPVYNNLRKDIASLFPEYANSNGAIGYFYINTNNYADGLHTISWSVRDSAGNTEGIGSRYFTIKNDM